MADWLHVNITSFNRQFFVHSNVMIGFKFFFADKLVYYEYFLNFLRKFCLSKKKNHEWILLHRPIHSNMFRGYIYYTTFSPFTDCRTFCPIWVRWRKSAISYRKYCGGKQSTKVRVAKMATSNGRFAKNCWNFFFWGWHFVLNIICTFASNWSIFWVCFYYIFMDEMCLV